MTIASINLSNLDGSNGFRLDGETADGLIFREISVSNAGDVNGDGFDDVIIGTLRADPNSSILGSGYVVFARHPALVPQWIYPTLMAVTVSVWMVKQRMIDRVGQSAAPGTLMAMVSMI